MASQPSCSGERFAEDNLLHDPEFFNAPEKAAGRFHTPGPGPVAATEDGRILDSKAEVAEQARREGCFNKRNSRLFPGQGGPGLCLGLHDHSLA